MATGTYAPDPFEQYGDNNGNPLNAGKLYTYLAGTSTLQATYSDVALSVANANPVILDTAGRPTSGAIFLTPGASYKFVLQDSTGATIATRDNVSAVPASSSNLDVTGTAGEALTAGQAVYLSDGSGSKTAGQWFKADSAQAYSSILPEVGLVPASIASAASGTIRLAGQVTGLSALVVGTKYYVGTAGALTATAPTNNRRILGVADTTSSLVFPDPSILPVAVDMCDGRLTLTTATPVTTSDVTAATTLYFTPYKGNRIALYDGTNWSVRAFAELSIAIPATTSQMYDVWVYDNAGTLALELLAWTNDTTRATALTTQDGIYAKTGALTRRYVGSVRTTTVSGQTEDSAAKRHLYNYYNRIRKPLLIFDATDSWSGSGNVLRQVRGQTTNQVALVNGVEQVVDLNAMLTGANSVAGVTQLTSIGEDSTSAIVVGSVIHGVFQMPVNTLAGNTAMLRRTPAVGYHFYAWLEQSAAGATHTWYGDNGGTTLQSGMVGSVDV